MRTTRLAATFATAAALIATAGCSGGSKEAAGPADAGSLTFGTLNGALISFNPWLSPSGDNTGLMMNQMSYDALTHVEPDGEITPGLATSWKYTDPKTMTLKLRTDAKFDDGTPVDAAAVKANFDYAKTAVPAGQRTPYIAALTTTVVDKSTLKVVSAMPQPDLPTDFATGGGFIVNPKALKNPSSLKAKPSGSGPYTLTASTAGQRYDFTRRKDHWDLKQYPYRALHLKNFSSLQAQENALKTGQIQGAVGQPQQLESDRAAGLNVHLAKPTTIGGIWLNDRAGKVVPALGKVKVRQALNYAIDREAIQKAVYHGIGQPGALIVPKGLDGHSTAAEDTYSYDPAKAKKLLAEAGYPKGFTLPFLGTGADDRIGQAVAGYLRKVGVNMQIKAHSADYANELRSGKWAATGFAWTMTPPAQAMGELLSPTGAGNFNRSTDPEIEKLLARTRTTAGAAQTKAMEELVEAVNDKAWFLIAGYNPNVYVTGKNVTCDIGQRTICPLYTFRPAEGR
ncbi:ABC transporter substrate-binding protein [Streptomyces sp. NPDC102462]|uniref:ABC transporter substrate-binding protein n=1 Tax=Streptomyces sp. NPDC102462 TaxID=3366178 RepID=UPI0037FCC2D9